MTFHFSSEIMFGLAPLNSGVFLFVFWGFFLVLPQKGKCFFSSNLKFETGTMIYSQELRPFQCH